MTMKASDEGMTPAPTIRWVLVRQDDAPALELDSATIRRDTFRRYANVSR